MKRVCEMNQSELNEFYAAAKKEYEAGRWSKAMLKILVQRKPQRLTEAEYTEITGEQYAGT